VAIIGSGPCGLLLGQLLHLAGIDTLVLEHRSAQYVLGRIRAGVLEQGMVEMLNRAGVGERLRAEGLVHSGFDILFGGVRRRVDLSGLTGGRKVVVYGQTEVTKDLMDARAAAGAKTVYEADEVSIRGFDTDRPVVRYRKDGGEQEVHCDFIAGCDGFHGVCRPSIPEGALTVFERVYPFAWLGILVDAETEEQETVYAWHESGFGFFNRRSPEITRHFLQVAPDEAAANWPDERIWRELEIGSRPTTGGRSSRGRFG